MVPGLNHVIVVWFVPSCDQKITKNQLKKTKWNSNVPIGGAWQEDLYHKLMNKGYIFKGTNSKTVT